MATKSNQGNSQIMDERREIRDENSAGDKRRVGDPSIRQLLRDYADHSSLHAVWQVGNSSYGICRRVIWASALLAGITVLVIAFAAQLKYFLQYKVNTVLSVQEQATLAFPAVTICNYNQFRKSLASKQETTARILQELFSVDAKLQREKENVIQSESQVSQDWNVTQNLIELSHRLEDMVVFCHWCGRTIPCEDYFTMTMTEVGVCYTFNSRDSRARHPPLVVHDAGSDCGLLFRINIENDEYFYGEGSSAGIQVMVHDPVEVPLVRQYGFSVAPGTTTQAPVKLTRTLFAQSPYGDCLDTDIEGFQNPLKYYDIYTYTACKLEHRVDYVYNICKCVMYYDPGDRAICKTVEEVICYGKAKENHTVYAMQAMRRACPNTCTSNSYDVKLSYASFPAQQVLDELQADFNWTEQQVKKNLLQLKVYFEDLGIHTVDQEPAYTGASLFADVGGEMGLCIGASLLTLVEVIELLGNIVAKAISR